MKPNNTTKKPISKGLGFGNALMGIKDIAMTYEDLQGGPPPVVKQPLPNKSTLIKKQIIPTKKQQNSPIVQGNKFEIAGGNKQTFKINAGKEFEQFKQVPFLPIESCQRVYELTTNGKLSNWEYNVFCQGIEAKLLVPDPSITFAFSASDVKQGGLGNCYFISTLASLAHLPKTLVRRIPKYKSYGPNDKFFEANLFQSGKNVQINVDNLFPQIFAKPVENDISLMVLQKAYAQLYGNYQITNIGHSCDAMRDMTGAPTTYIDLKNKATLISKLSKAWAAKYPLIIASKMAVKMTQLSPKHSFNILDIALTEGGTNIMLKLRDPRGINCSQFPILKDISEADRTNGMFWIDYKLLVENFQVITSCQVNQNCNYLYRAIKSKDLKNAQACLQITIKKRGHFTISCHQKHKKFYDDKFNYKMLRILLAKIMCKEQRLSPESIIATDFNIQQVCSISCELQPGQYLLFSKIGTGSTTIPSSNQAMTLSFYTTCPIESLEVSQLTGQVPINQFLKKYVRNHAEQFKQSRSDKGLERYFGPLYGYLCVFYINNSGKSVMEELEYDVENIKVGDKKISLLPKQEKLLMHEIGQKNNASHKFSFKTKTVYK